MRSFLAGLFLLSIAASGAWGQATGSVTVLGFQYNYRPDCWTPLRVHLDSTLSKPADYQIQVHQQDLDRDVVVFSRTVPLGPQAHQDYWVYFIPQPVGRRDEGGSLPSRPADMAAVLKVYLYDKAGKTQVAALPANFQASNIDPYYTPGVYSHGRGRKMVLCVMDRESNDVVRWEEYAGGPGRAGAGDDGRGDVRPRHHPRPAGQRAGLRLGRRGRLVRRRRAGRSARSAARRWKRCGGTSGGAASSWSASRRRRNGSTAWRRWRTCCRS